GGRQSIHVDPARAGFGHRQNEVALPVHATRHARLGRTELASPARSGVAGKPRKVVVHANRNGFFYMLDRTTGEFLRATKLIDNVTWASGIDAKGRPILVIGKDPTPQGNWVCPSVKGATNWMSQTYNPLTGL